MREDDDGDGCQGGLEVRRRRKRRRRGRPPWWEACRLESWGGQNRRFIYFIGQPTQHSSPISLSLPTRLASLPPASPSRACEMPRMLPTMIQDIYDVPPSSFFSPSLSPNPSAPTCPGHHLSTSYFVCSHCWLVVVCHSVVGKQTSGHPGYCHPVSHYLH